MEENAASATTTTTATGKRPRDDAGESSPELAKRLHAEQLLLDILDDVPESSQEAGEDLATVMRSLEVEIALPSSPRPATAAIQEEAARPVEQHELGYLLEASDDELGIPPTTLPSSSVAVVEDDPETDGVVPGWSLGKDDAGCYDAFDLGFSDCVDNAVGVHLPGGYFDDDLQIDLMWRPEFLPTV